MTETDTKLVKYDRPLSSPLQTPENARDMLLAHQANLGQHIARAAGVDIGQVVSTAISVIATAEPKLQAALLGCTGQSVLKSVADAARYGLVFGSVFGQAYLVPFKSQCTLIVGYRGLEALVYRSGVVKAIQSAVVYEGDEYDVQIGRQPPILHKPNPNAKHDIGKIVAAYAMAWLSPELAIAEPMNRQDLEHIRSKSKTRTVDLYAHEPEMFRKAPVRRLCKHLPLSPSDRAMLDEILAREDEREGVHVSPAEGVIEGEARAKAILEGKAATVEPAPQADPTVAARGYVLKLVIARAKRIHGNADNVLANTTKEVLGDSVGLSELSLDQAVLVREFLESQNQEGAGQ